MRNQILVGLIATSMLSTAAMAREGSFYIGADGGIETEGTDGETAGCRTSDSKSLYSPTLTWAGAGAAAGAGAEVGSWSGPGTIGGSKNDGSGSEALVGGGKGAGKTPIRGVAVSRSVRGAIVSGGGVADGG